MDQYNKLNTIAYDSVLSAFEELALLPRTECGTARKEACKLTASLFPLFKDDNTNDERISDFNLEQYGYYRSLGMSVTNTAYALQFSAKLLFRLLNGEKVSLERFIDLIKQELFARAECKASLLKNVKEATTGKDWRTSLTLLEKLYPEEFNTGGHSKQEPILVSITGVDSGVL